MCEECDGRFARGSMGSQRSLIHHDLEEESVQLNAPLCGTPQLGPPQKFCEGTLLTKSLCYPFVDSIHSYVELHAVLSHSVAFPALDLPVHSDSYLQFSRNSFYPTLPDCNLGISRNATCSSPKNQTKNQNAKIVSNKDLSPIKIHTL